MLTKIEIIIDPFTDFCANTLLIKTEFVQLCEYVRGIDGPLYDLAAQLNFPDKLVSDAQ